MRFFFSSGRAAWLAALALLLPACDSGTTDPPPADNILFGINYTRLFAPATDAEIAAVRADWAARAPASSALSLEGEATVGGATVRVVSHTVTAVGCETVTHYAAVRIPDGLEGQAPMLVVHHGGDDGFSISSLAGLATLYPSLFSQTVQVMPVYRSEALTTTGFADLGGPYTATGTPSPWDCDVDDAIATVDAVLAAYPEVVSATDRVAIGFSRGGNTAALHAVRDGEIDGLVDYFGPTDFFNATVQGLTTLAVNADPGVLSLPGVRYLAETVLLPLRNADGTYNASADYGRARTELARRSPGLFASDLPETQVHHHRGDGVVPFEFSVAFDATATARGAGDRVELFLYGAETPASAANHDPQAMPESLSPVQTFLLARAGR